MEKFTDGSKIVEAVQWTNEPHNFTDILVWSNHKINSASPLVWNEITHNSHLYLQCESKKGFVLVHLGDWVVKDDEGFCPIKKEYFEATFSPISRTTLTDKK